MDSYWSFWIAIGSYGGFGWLNMQWIVMDGYEGLWIAIDLYGRQLVDVEVVDG